MRPARMRAALLALIKDCGMLFVYAAPSSQGISIGPFQIYIMLICEEYVVFDICYENYVLNEHICMRKFACVVK